MRPQQHVNCDGTVTTSDAVHIMRLALNMANTDTKGGTRSLPGLIGDVDGNGMVGMADVNLAMRCALGIVELDEAAMLRADVNGDGIVDVADVNLICRIALELSGNN